MYLMDGSHRIMISKALNESDRLSGCSKGARKYLAAGQAKNLFNVYNFQTVEDADTGGIPDEFLVRYNIGGIHINALAFQKLQKEIALKEHLIELADHLVKGTSASFHGCRAGRTGHLPQDHRA
jgi:hypothetical protein